MGSAEAPALVFIAKCLEEMWRGWLAKLDFYRQIKWDYWCHQDICDLCSHSFPFLFQRAQICHDTTLTPAVLVSHCTQMYAEVVMMAVNPLKDCTASSIGGHCSHLKKKGGSLWSVVLPFWLPNLKHIRDYNIEPRWWIFCGFINVSCSVS